MKFRLLFCLASFASFSVSTSLSYGADATRGIEIQPKAVVVSLKGTATAAQSGKLAFRHAVAFGELIRTGEDSYASILIPNSAVLVMLDHTELELGEESQAQIIKLHRGTIRLAVAESKIAAGQTVVVQTPNSRAATNGTLAQIEVSAGTKKASLELARRNLVQAIAANQASNVENFNVYEGAMEVNVPGNPPAKVGSGQAVEVTDGNPGQPVSVSAFDDFVPGLLADEDHGETPQPLFHRLSNQEMSQAQALGNALAGEAGAATTLADQNEDQIILASSTSGTNQPLPRSPFGSGSNPFGGDNPNPINFSGTGFGDDHNDSSPLPEVNLTSIIDGQPVAEINVKGGSGLLLFQQGKRAVDALNRFRTENKASIFTTKSELLLVDGGNRAAAPHGGVAPTDTLVIGGLTADHTKLSLQRAAGVDAPGTLALQAVINEDVVLATRQQVQPLYVIIHNDGTVETTSSRVRADQAARGVRPVRIYDVSDNNLKDFPKVEHLRNLSFFSSESDGAVAEVINSFVAGAITARSPTEGTIQQRTVTLEGGVVLDQTTELTVGTTPATGNFFGANPEYDGSVIGVIAKDGNPAFVKIKDRALGVVGGSTIAPDGGNRTSLLSVLDSQLIGPNAVPPERLGGDVRIPPLIEVVDSKPRDPGNPNNAGVQAASAFVVRSTGLLNGVIDDGLLKASAPLIALVNSTMRTSGSFADFSGPGKLLNATLVPADALVRLDASNLTVNGHAFSFTNGASASITGNMVSLTNDSTFSIANGAFINIGSGSSVNLTGSFASFGSGNNQLSVTNDFCSASCTFLNGTLPVAGTGNINGKRLTGGTLNLPKRFALFRSLDGQSTNPDGSNRVSLNNSPNTAFLVVNGNLNLRQRRDTNPSSRMANRR